MSKIFNKQIVKLLKVARKPKHISFCVSGSLCGGLSVLLVDFVCLYESCVQTSKVVDSVHWTAQQIQAVVDFP